MINLEYLEAVAKAATPGPWQVTGSEDEVETAWTPQERGAKKRPGVCIDEPLCVVCAGDYTGGCRPADASYIAAVNPAAVLELIEELQEKNALLEEIFDDCGGKNNGACPVCSTYTHKNWCWYPHLTKILGKPLDKFDMEFLDKEQSRD